VDRPEALAGGRIGVPEWTQTATVYGRGLLAEFHGVRPEEVDWVQAGTNEPGRKEGIGVRLPEGIAVTAEPERTLDEMLQAGDLDAVIAAHPPAGFDEPDGPIVRLFPDHRAAEEDFFRRTGVFPIMHVVCLRADVHRAHPWVAMNLLTALEEAKAASLARAVDVNAPRLPVPWAPAHATDMQALFGSDPWPYGVAANRTTLDWFLARAHEQGVCARRLAPEELFAVQTLERFRI
jgi:4,5-dihydroxyphthalate decarboxylase